MPTVLRFDGLRVVPYPNDHRPAHVHVKGAKGEAVFVPNCPGGPRRLRDSSGFSRPELGRIPTDVAENVARLCAEWEALHGHHR